MTIVKNNQVVASTEISPVIRRAWLYLDKLSNKLLNHPGEKKNSPLRVQKSAAFLSFVSYCEREYKNFRHVDDQLFKECYN